jgi:RNA polymerase sigma-70 factor (ECF subfamily)
MEKTQELTINVITRWDADAARMLYEHFYGALVSYGMRILQDRELAEDAVQDTMAALWEKKIILPNNAALKAYLYNSVRNKCINLIRQQKIKRVALHTISEYEEYKLTENHEEQVFSEEVYRQLFLMIDQMPPRQREVFLMVMEGKKNREIAQALDMASETVRTNKKRAMAFLKKNLDNETLALLFVLLEVY